MKKAPTYLVSCTCAFVLSLCNLAFAQADLQGSQYIFNKTYINPAFSGAEGPLNANIFYQVNDPGIGTIKNTNTISSAVDGLFPNKHSAWGLNFVKSRFGNDSYTVANVNYAYHLNLSEDLTLSSGLGLGFQQFNIDLLNAQTVSPNDPVSGNNVYSSKSDARAGFRLQYQSKYYGGISFDNLLSIYSSRDDFKNSVPQMFRRISMYGIIGANISYPSGFNLQPSLLFMKTFGGQTAMEFSAMVEFINSLSLGLSLRQNISAYESSNAIKDYRYQSIIRPMLQYDLSKKNNLRLGYCYSFNVNKTSSLKASNDFSIVYNIPTKVADKK
jgi:type IX secretion system PorP/SprF family membrane protein